jgi:hypothetical protein
MPKGKRTTGKRTKPFGPRERRVVALLAMNLNPTEVARRLGDVRRQLVYELMRRPEYPDEFARARRALAIKEGAADEKALEAELAAAKLAGDLNGIAQVREKLARNHELLDDIQVESRAEQMHRAHGGGDSPEHGIRDGRLDDPGRLASLQTRGHLSQEESAELRWLMRLPRSRRFWRITNEMRIAEMEKRRLAQAEAARARGDLALAERIMREQDVRVGTPFGPPLYIPLDIAADLLRQHGVEPTGENIDRVVAQHIELELRRLAPSEPHGPLDAVVPWGAVSTGEIVAVNGDRRPTPRNSAAPPRKVNGWWVRRQLFDAAFAEPAAEIAGEPPNLVAEPEANLS